MSEEDVSGLIAALGEVMKTPACWRSRAPGSHHPEAVLIWSQPRRDHDDGFVYLTGPCGHEAGRPGYRQTAERTIIAEGRHRTIGLTPAAGDAVALMLWSTPMVSGTGPASQFLV